MDQVRKNLKNKKGFTLAELLIVVAIIAVLVAVSVPIFNSKLEKAREATDIANMRAAKVAAAAEYLGDGEIGTFYYDADKGVLVPSTAKDTVAGYGQGTSTAKGGLSYGSYYTEATEAKGKIIEVKVDEPTTKDKEPTIVLEWVDATKTK